MRSLITAIILTFLTCITAFADASDKQAEITRLILTHAGSASITETVEASDQLQIRFPFQRDYRPESLIFTGAKVLTARLQTESIAVAEPSAIQHNLGDLQQDLAGQLVTLYFKRTGEAPLKGKLLDWVGKKNPAERPFLIIQEGKNVRYIDPDSIDMLQFLTISTTKPFIRKLPLFEIKFIEKTPPSTKLKIHYLTDSITWVPTYGLEIIDNTRLRLSLLAGIKNTFNDLDNAEIELLIGSPVIEKTALKNTASQDLENATNRGTLAASHSVWAGTHSMKKGDSLHIVAEAREATYEPIVYWNIPQNRHPDGTFSERPLGTTPSQLRDAIRFSNPFTYPLPAGTVNIHEKERFKANTHLDFCGVGENALLPLDTAARIRADVSERETLSEKTTHNGQEATRLTLNGTLLINNYRQNPITLVIDRTLTGTVLNATDTPLITGIWQATHTPNPQQRLTWQLTLRPGEEKTITYRYSLLCQP